MRLIAITSPEIIDEDARIIAELLDRGVEIIHLRKPEADICECRKLLQTLTPEQRKNIVIHDFPDLYYEFSLKGIHVNKNIKSLPDDYTGLKTRSCHSINEIIKYKKEYDYMFLSPVFDSISKVGYKSGFTEEELQKASEDGIIDEKVIALGGVTFEKIPYLESMKFGGVAMLGGIYNLKVLDELRDVNLSTFYGKRLI